VDYPLRLSDPVTTSPPAVPGMVPDSPNLQTRCCARYKCSLGINQEAQLDSLSDGKHNSVIAFLRPIFIMISIGIA